MSAHKGSMSIRMTDKRARLIREVMQLTGEKTKAGAIDLALAHYIEDHRQKSKVVQNLDMEVIEALSRNQMPMELEQEFSVGRT